MLLKSTSRIENFNTRHYSMQNTEHSTFPDIHKLEKNTGNVCKWTKGNLHASMNESLSLILKSYLLNIIMDNINILEI